MFVLPGGAKITQKGTNRRRMILNSIPKEFSFNKRLRYAIKELKKTKASNGVNGLSKKIIDYDIKRFNNILKNF